MDKNTLTESIKEIGSCEDVNERLSKLTELQDNMYKVFDENDTLKKDKENLTSEIAKKEEEIVKANKYAMDMFLKVGEQKTESQRQEENTGIKAEEEKQYKSYKDLAKNYM